MAIGDQYGPIYQFAIRGNRGTEVGVTPLDQEKQIVQFWIQGGRVIGPNEYGANVMLWNWIRPAVPRPKRSAVPASGPPSASPEVTLRARRLRRRAPFGSYARSLCGLE